MLLCFTVAKRLGMTLTRLLSETTREEILGWDAYFQLEDEARAKAIKQAR